MPSVAGGSIITAGGLVFNGSIAFSGFRAVDVNTGEELWSEPLPAASDATPMSYVSPRTGKQFVVVTSPAPNPVDLFEAASDDEKSEQEKKPVQGGRVIAYGLPD